MKGISLIAFVPECKKELIRGPGRRFLSRSGIFSSSRSLEQAKALGRDTFITVYFLLACLHFRKS